MVGEAHFQQRGSRSSREIESLLEGPNAGNVMNAPVPGITSENVEAGGGALCRICLECDDADLIAPCMCKGTQQFVHRACLDRWRSVKEGFAFTHCTTCKSQFKFRIVVLKASSWRKMKFKLFVARDIFLVFLSVQMLIGLIGVLAFLLDHGRRFRTSYGSSWDLINSRHPFSFYYCIGAIGFLLVFGVFGLLAHCFTLDTSDPRVAGCQNCFYACGMLDCFPALSMEACFIYVVIIIVLFVALGIAYSFFAATMAIQRICQRHYHILTKRQLTQEYIVEDLHGNYTPPTLDPSHEERLRMLGLM